MLQGVSRKLLTEAAHTPLCCAVLGADFGKDSIASTSCGFLCFDFRINGVSLLNLQKLMVFTLVGEN